jgi:outer membrane lipoprotein-sorting protein
VAGPGQSGANEYLASLVTKYKQTKSASFDFTYTLSTGQTSSGKEWISNETGGTMVKIETTTPKGVKEVIIADLQTGTVTIYQPSTNQGTVTKSTLSSVQSPIGSLKNVSLGDLKDLGTAVVNGETCRVIEHSITHAGTNGQSVTDEVTVWLSERLAFPVKEAVTTPAGATSTIEFTNINLGPLPVDTFNVPASVKITTA